VNLAEPLKVSAPWYAQGNRSIIYPRWWRTSKHTAL